MRIVVPFLNLPYHLFSVWWHMYNHVYYNCKLNSKIRNNVVALWFWSLFEIAFPHTKVNFCVVQFGGKMGGSWKSEKFGLQVDGPLEIARWLIFHEEAKYLKSYLKQQKLLRRQALEFWEERWIRNGACSTFRSRFRIHWERNHKWNVTTVFAHCGK